jgi:thiosulfate reductase cytochrome b subunit
VAEVPEDEPEPDNPRPDNARPDETSSARPGSEEGSLRSAGPDTAGADGGPSAALADKTAVPAPEPLARATPSRRAREVIYRHSLLVRITHWVNVVAISLLLMSGMQIFNAHPRLYWGAKGADFDQPFLVLGAANRQSDHPIGMTIVAGHAFVTTGVLGVSTSHGASVIQGFPSWATLPSWRDLARGRRWHFFLAWVFVLNGAAYLLAGLLSGHFRRDLAPTRTQLRPSHIARDIWDHIRLRHPSGEAAKSYNVLQKFAYLVVVFALLPAMVLTGLTMSPGFDAVAPWLLDLFGGRQSARTIHFISANLIVLFVLVHVVEVFIAGVFNEIGSMITGRYRIRPEPAE